MATASSDYITKADYAKLTGVGRSTVTYWIDSGSLPADCLVLRGNRQMIYLPQAIALGVFDKHSRAIEQKNTNTSQEITNPELHLELPEEQKQETAIDGNSWWNQLNPANEELNNTQRVKQDPRYISKIEYAQVLGIAPSLVTKWIIQGEIPAPCLISHEGREKIDLLQMLSVGILDRHTLAQKQVPAKCVFTEFFAFQKIEEATEQTEQIQRTEQTEQTEQILRTEQTEQLGKLLSLQDKLAVNAAAAIPARNRTKTEQELDFFEAERKARLQKLQAEAAIADMNQRRAEGKLVDTDRLWDLWIDLCSTLNSFLDQHIEQSAAALYGNMNDIGAIKDVLEKRANTVRDRIRDEFQKKKAEAQLLISTQTKPLKF